MPFNRILLIFLCFTIQYAQAQNSIFSIPDTMLRQGARVHIPITLSTISDVKQQTCTVTIAIPKKRIILHDAFTEPRTLFSCKKTDITFLSDGDEFKEYAITCPNPLFDSVGTLCYLDIEALAGRDTVLDIRVMKITIGDSIHNIQQIGGKITFKDPPVMQASSEGMDINSPNPFAYTTSFNYYIGKPGPVQFFLFNAQGKLIKEYPIEQKITGRHSFTLIVDNPMDFSSGVYVIRMKTEQGVYHMSMVNKK